MMYVLFTGTIPFFFFFFYDTATTEIYTLSLHDALPIFSRTLASLLSGCCRSIRHPGATTVTTSPITTACIRRRSEEHTSELQSQSNLVCRLLLEKKNITSISKCQDIPSRKSKKSRFAPG